jgi:FkbM family methyltransferase
MQYHLVLKSSVVHSPYKKAHYVTPNDRKEYYMTKNELLSELDRVERFANQSRFQRLLTTPRKYLFGLLYKNLFYRMHSSGKRIDTCTFFRRPIQLVLPGAMDIYLCGGKTHASEIRLARFLIHHLCDDDTFLDIGAHIGYFSLLASEIVTNGQVVAVEASPTTFSLLTHNISPAANIKAMNLALADDNGTIDFLEFPVLYAEFNTQEKEQYKQEEWFKKVKPQIVNTEAMNGSDFISMHELNPAMIKIDVEGAEEKVIRGLLDFLNSTVAYVVMEFANRNRGNANHKMAEQHLCSVGYSPHFINNEGELETILGSTDDYISASGMESDNIVYLKM